MKLLICGGDFNKEQGKKSKIIEKLSVGLGNIFSTEVLNGGNLEDIKNLNFLKYDVVLWSPNISNDEEKIIPNIKQINQKVLLISTKRVIEKEYTDFDVVGHLLKNKSNLGIKITKENDRYQFKLIDPLGNEYYSGSEINLLAESIGNRVKFIKGLKRVKSQKVGEKRDFKINEEFIEFIKHTGSEFTKYVNAINPNRFLGNASTRCMFGFPAEKQNERLFVTQRNIDKELIETNGFVEVSNNTEVVEYYGDKKPSVDTPIQIRLFDYYKNINFMVHGHVYIENEKMTKSKIPCGFVEEFEEIIELYPSREEISFAINLKGHGCLIVGSKVSDLWEYAKFESRELTEK